MPIKSTTTTGEEKGGEENIPKESTEQVKTQEQSMFFLSHCYQSPSLAGSHSPPHLPRMPSNTVLISGPAVGAAEILIWSYSCVFLPPVFAAIRASAFFFFWWEFSVSFSIFRKHRICLVDRVNLICSLYSWSEGFESYSLATLPLGFNCGFISTSACGSSTGV